MKHTLKTWPEYFGSVLSEAKTFELRRNDREFKVGDTLILEEYGPNIRGYSGRKIEAVITYVLSGTVATGFGLMDGFCILSFTIINKII
jgi:uncharacterized protein DUF3850